MSDEAIVNYLRREKSATIAALIAYTGVTATAVRQRLSRLMDKGYIERSACAAGRGRPTHHYSLTAEGARSAGTSYGELVQVLWDEIRSVSDPTIRRGLLTRISERLAGQYRRQVDGETADERMSSLASLLSERQIPFEVRREGQLPVLTALACPYPDLAAVDRGVCAMEKMMLSSVVGEGLRLSGCRLDGDSYCTFERHATEAAPS